VTPKLLRDVQVSKEFTQKELAKRSSEKRTVFAPVNYVLADSSLQCLVLRSPVQASRDEGSPIGFRQNRMRTERPALRSQDFDGNIEISIHAPTP